MEKRPIPGKLKKVKTNRNLVSNKQDKGERSQEGFQGSILGR